MWKIEKANNAKKEYVLKRRTGEVLTVRVPEEHRGEIAAGAYVAATKDGHDSQLYRHYRRRAAEMIAAPIVAVASAADLRAAYVLIPALTIYCGIHLLRQVKNILAKKKNK
jgi:hypothetical protein